MTRRAVVREGAAGRDAEGETCGTGARAETADEETPARNPAPRLALGALLAAMAFCAVPVNESLAAAALGSGVMRIVFAGGIAGLLWHRGDELWYPVAAGVSGAVIGALLLQLGHPCLAHGALLLQAAAVAPVTLVTALLASRGAAKAASTAVVLFVCGALLWQVGWVPGGDPPSDGRAFVGFALLVVVAGYALARRYVEPAGALLAPMWLAAYFTYPLVSQWTAFAEFYGGGMGVVMLWLVSRQRWFAGAAALALAVSGSG